MVSAEAGAKVGTESIFRFSLLLLSLDASGVSWALAGEDCRQYLERKKESQRAVVVLSEMDCQRRQFGVRSS